MNIPDDLTPDEWEEAITALHAANADVGEHTIVVRSHLWPQTDGTYDWVLVVPGSEHRARGNSPSIGKCYEAMDVLIVEWYPQAADPATRMTVGRMIPERIEFNR